MNATLKLPPSGRDYDIYAAVRVQERTTREVAAEFRISQTRVCQIVERVDLFLLEVTPEGTEEQRAKRVYIAEQISAARVQHLQGQAARCFEASQQQEQTTRITQDALGAQRSVTTIRVNHGETRYLAMGARQALIAAKLPYPTLSHHFEYEDESCEDEFQEEHATAPAKEDCSNRAVSNEVRAEVTARDQATSNSAAVGCAPAASGDERRNDRAARPVQAPARPLNDGQKSRRQAFLAAG